MGKKESRRKLSRQYAVMVFAVQMVMVIIIGILVRMESINIYLSAKNDMISEMLRKEAVAMDKDIYNPAPSWCFDYWKAHYPDLLIDLSTFEEEITDEETDYFYELSEELGYEDEETAEEFLNAMPEDEQLLYAKFQLFDYMELFGRKTDYYGYEGCSCFIDIGNGEYLILVDKDEDRNSLSDSVYIEESSDSKDKMMEQLSAHTYEDNDADAEYIRAESIDENGQSHKLYIGYVPVVYNGEIKAVITLYYNYDLFVSKIDNMLILAMGVIIAVNLLVCIMFIHRTNRIATNPISSIQGAVRNYITTKSSSDAVSALDKVHSDNEIGVLAEDVKEMVVTIDDYIGEVKAAGEKHKALTKDVMEALASAIDAKDRYTNGHSKRVAEYSRKIAEILGKTPEECEMIYSAGLLHDVGKIGVPLEILQKKGRLTDEEFEQIKLHPVTGGEILSQIHEFPFLMTGALYHHERYNGRGYPEGLKGEQIPEVARIIAVADAYDAMTSNRSYRNAIPQHIVREEFVKGSGGQFDPDLARIMIHLIDLDIEYRMQESLSGEKVSAADSLHCTSLYDSCTGGIAVSKSPAMIQFCSQPDEGVSDDKCIPSIIVFDSLDGLVHKGEEENKNLLYFEYAKIRLDGQLDASGVRKSEIRNMTNDTDIDRPDLDDPENGQLYKIITFRSRDHLLIRVSTEEKMFDVILALPDTSRATYISITGENCEIHNLRVEADAKDVPAAEIPRIEEEISYIKNCPEGDIPNIEIDGPRTASTEGIKITGDMMISFHTMSYPTARLIWHCPYFCIYSSPEGQTGGDDYHEYMLLKLDGETWDPEENVKNEVTATQTESFDGWNSWIRQNKHGLDVIVNIQRKGNTVILKTENAGVMVESSTTVTDGADEIYLSLTGDQCAITNIRIKRLTIKSQ